MQQVKEHEIIVGWVERMRAPTSCLNPVCGKLLGLTSFDPTYRFASFPSVWEVGFKSEAISRQPVQGTGITISRTRRNKHRTDLTLWFIILSGKNSTKASQPVNGLAFKNEKRLTQGSIVPSLLRMALPIITDPLLIFGFGPIPALGTNGAALATILSQCVVSLIFYRKIFKGESVIDVSKHHFQLISSKVRRTAQLGFPIAMHSALFACFSVAIAKMVAVWGALPIVVQSVGAQIEAVY